MSGLFFGPRERLLSPLPPAECVARLRTVVISPVALIASGTLQDWAFTGAVDDDRLHVRRSHRFSRANAQNAFYGRIIPDQGGTRIEGRFRPSIGGLVFLALWTLVVGGFGVAVLTTDLFAPSDRPKVALGCAAMVLAVLAFQYLGRRLSRAHDADVLRMLGATTEARRLD
ncbi:hypothetical protein [Reyranella sp. CPCC 100927]|uniref:hypothetical protein n=1 Tax=Reyranella sp. CPCC 100927 TaxID=2599616 RepID=UPI0011B7A292|nr:hypothetical protein [Reyranella sp. CPCC 100927]TWT11439.1 hypothetical protein FQU96_13195 [Reyranella sp. CPCC 100927]